MKQKMRQLATGERKIAAKTKAAGLDKVGPILFVRWMVGCPAHLSPPHIWLLIRVESTNEVWREPGRLRPSKFTLISTT